MSAEIYLDFGGSIKSGVKDKGYQDWIELNGWHWSVSNSKDVHTKTEDHGAGHSVGDIVIDKLVDATSAPLIMSCLKGEVHKEVTLVVVGKYNNESIETVKLKMENVVVSHLGKGIQKGAGSNSESMTLHFSKFTYEYTPVVEGVKQASKSVSFDIKAGEVA